MTDIQKQSSDQKRTPDLYVHTKIVSGTSDRIGARIGCGFLHSDGVGVNIILDATPHVNPFSGQIELVAFAPKD